MSKEERRYNKWKQIDPYPNIDPALLNSADIQAYIEKVAMVSPFYPENLKGASYDVAIKGKVVYWDEKGEKKEKNLLREGDSFDLSPNSIAFVTMEPEFRIPYYIALRFNLKITHIYKGLLLGTGPLVDPGFCGKLSIPLHNLTGNTYRFFKGDGLITMELTKMSKNKLWEKNMVNVGHSNVYTVNKIQNDRQVDEYVAKALKKDRLNSVISSIPNTMIESHKAITEAQETISKMEIASENAKKWSNIINIAGIVGIVTVVITSVTLTINSYYKSFERYDELYKKYEEVTKQYLEIEEQIQSNDDNKKQNNKSIK